MGPSVTVSTIKIKKIMKAFHGHLLQNRNKTPQSTATQLPPPGIRAKTARPQNETETRTCQAGRKGTGFLLLVEPREAVSGAMGNSPAAKTLIGKLASRDWELLMSPQAARIRAQDAQIHVPLPASLPGTYFAGR